MGQEASNTLAWRQVELIIRKLNSLSVLPQTAGQLFNILSGQSCDMDKLTELVCSDTALAAKILSLASANGIEENSLEAVLRKLPASVLRDAVLEVKAIEVFDNDYTPDTKKILPRRLIIIHSLAVAAASRLIAQNLSNGVDAQTAFAAGLLHDIGKFAIDEVMPKSFEKIIQQSRELNTSISEIERKVLGVDHCVVGKRLAEKWNLPEEMITPIWLHHEEAQLFPDMVGGKLAKIVTAADKVARSLGLGDSGNYEKTLNADDVLCELGFSRQKASEITSAVVVEVGQKKLSLALDNPAMPQSYINAMQDTVASVARTNSDLYKDNVKLQSESAVSKFLNSFISEVKDEQGAIEIAAKFAQGFAKAYQTGKVCVVVAGEGGQWDGAIVKGGEVEYTLIKSPENVSIESLKSFKKPVTIQDNAGWLFAKLGGRIDKNCMCVSLTAGGKFLGLLLFETSRPEMELAGLEQVLALVSTLIALAQSNYRQKRLSENFAYLLRELKAASGELAATRSMLAVAEMAAGAAHKFNHPLAVISGRAQLLAGSESDPERKQMLKQIQDRAGEVTSMISDLMFFASPPAPKKASHLLKSIIEDAVKTASEKADIAEPEVEITGVDNAGEVFVDKEQIVRAMANVIANAFESYPGSNGPVQINVNYSVGSEHAEIKIKDFGCGMDGSTMLKAAEPFFSARSAGRKRGMGLSHAQRLIQINEGTIKLSSAVQNGTVAVITLPRVK